jgi:hypothetical protein
MLGIICNKPGTTALLGDALGVEELILVLFPAQSPPTLVVLKFASKLDADGNVGADRESAEESEGTPMLGLFVGKSVGNGFG